MHLDMSLTVQQVVSDAKNLALKLKERNDTADKLILQGHTVHRKIDIMKQYAEDTAELNDTARHRPHSVLIAGIEHENRHLRDLQQENKELRDALEEQQNALELIMSKYRKQISKLVNSSKIDFSRMYTDTFLDQALKIDEMAAVMGRAIDVDEEEFIKNERQLKKLVTENENLRHLLNIANSNRSLHAEQEKTNVCDAKTSFQ
ncbi:FGFR1 oncogene partner 2 homolog [Cimex lectularius]|uniref:FGFR1 oncogene partner 2 homolog n=1 Tax=Cimex lectularius TaxID=79782 RepID=A0A8I6TGP2_CIMLE|nr:FGFR1 oncogene partner 2 homolog [Cimex lectularius]